MTLPAPMDTSPAPASPAPLWPDLGDMAVECTTFGPEGRPLRRLLRPLADVLADRPVTVQRAAG